MKYRNPIIPGFHPDPSICRAGDDYYLANSSFEYFPGVPLFHSRDLVHWRQIGHCLSRKSQLDLTGTESSGGIWAPTLRYHNGRFYMITTDFMKAGHFYVTTDDPAGEWSDPIRVEGPWFDPDLFFDDDGSAWFSFMNFDKGIHAQQIDIETGRPLSELQRIWAGYEDRFCEGPHIYKINGTYYLLVAEGGTRRGHMCVIARADRPLGPYEGCPHNPILTHRNQPMDKVQCTGHGDLVQVSDGSWWLVFLATRPLGDWHHLGRETFLAPVAWTEDGWPIVNDGNPITAEMAGPDLAPYPWPAAPVRDEFDASEPAFCWNFRRNPVEGDVSLTEYPGSLAVRCSPVTLNDVASPAMLCRRQEHFNCRVATDLDFHPAAPGEEAGLTVLIDEKHHYEIAVTEVALERCVIVRRRIGDLQTIVSTQPVGPGPVRLEVLAEPELYRFRFAIGDMEPVEVASGLTRYLSSEVAGGFTGVYFGLYATGSGRESDNRALFDWFEYEAGE